MFVVLHIWAVWAVSLLRSLRHVRLTRLPNRHINPGSQPDKNTKKQPQK